MTDILARIVVESYEHLISPVQWLTTSEKVQCTAMPSDYQYQSSQMLIYSSSRLNKSISGPITLVLESANGQQKPWGFGRKSVAFKCDGNIIKYGSVWETAQSISISNKRGAGLEQWDHLIDRALLKSVIWSLKVHFGHGTCQRRLFSMIRSSRRHFMSSSMWAFAEGRIELTNLQLQWCNSTTLVWMSLDQCLFCSFWWCVCTHDDKEATSGQKSSQMKVKTQPMSSSSHLALPSPILAPTSLGRG